MPTNRTYRSYLAILYLWIIIIYLYIINYILQYSKHNISKLRINSYIENYIKANKKILHTWKMTSDP